MALKYIAVAVVAVSITLFALQNNAPSSIRFAVWQVEAVPLATIILVSVALGVVLAGVPLLVERSRLRSLESRLDEAETQVGDARVRTPESTRAEGGPVDG
jgi:uncharacterized integral membrane protein